MKSLSLIQLLVACLILSSPISEGSVITLDSRNDFDAIVNTNVVLDFSDKAPVGSYQAFIKSYFESGITFMNDIEVYLVNRTWELVDSEFLTGNGIVDTTIKLPNQTSAIGLHLIRPESESDKKASIQIRLTNGDAIDYSINGLSPIPKFWGIVLQNEQSFISEVVIRRNDYPSSDYHAPRLDTLLTGNSGLATFPNYNGWVWLDFPYAYSWSESRWIYIWGNPWVRDLETNQDIHLRILVPEAISGKDIKFVLGADSQPVISFTENVFSYSLTVNESKETGKGTYFYRKIDAVKAFIELSFTSGPLSGTTLYGNMYYDTMMTGLLDESIGIAFEITKDEDM